jgi:hypothetical protein
MKADNEFWFIGFNERTRKYRLIDRYTTNTYTTNTYTTNTLTEAKTEFKTRNRFKKNWVYTIATSRFKWKKVIL